jgi:hypothetical protein
MESGRCKATTFLSQTAALLCMLLVMTLADVCQGMQSWHTDMGSFNDIIMKPGQNEADIEKLGRGAFAGSTTYNGSRPTYKGSPRINTVVSMGSSPSPKPEQPKPPPTYEEIYETLKKEFVRKEVIVTPEMVRQHHLGMIRTLAAAGNINLTVIAECERLIEYYPDSEEAKEAQRILDQTQEAQKILLENQRKERAWIGRVSQQFAQK